MRQVRSFGSVKAIFLDRDELIRRLREVAAEALEVFPQLLEVRLIGSLATGIHSGTSDIDLLVRVSGLTGNLLEAMRPYYFFFYRRLELGLDLLLLGETPPEGMEEVLRGSIVLAVRG